MHIQTEIQQEISYQIKFFITQDEKIIGRVFLVVIQNESHTEPYGLLEDLFVEEAFRGKGYAKQLVQEVIKKSKELGCYKLIAQSRYGRDYVHAWYERLGFSDHGKNFRINFK